MSLPVFLIATLATSGLLMLALYFAYDSSRTDEIKIYPKKPRRLSWGARARNVGFNMLLSGGLVVAASLGLSDYLFSDQEISWLRFGWQVLACLGLYDLLYYLMHRFLFHEWKFMREVHVVHHTNKGPIVTESLFAHPLEIGMGVVLLIGCVAAVGPISMSSFGVVFFVWSFLNLLIHSGLDFPQRLLRPIAYLNRKHAKHHSSMRAGNYASISPIPDILFGTAQ